MKNEISSSTIIKYDITHMGYPKSLRGIKNMITYFGTQAESPENTTATRNDIELNLQDASPSARCFKIYYSKIENEYFLKDLGEGPGVFTRIEGKMPLKQGNVLIFGQHHLAISYKLTKDIDHNCKINIQLINTDKPPIH
eukprot:TRINITY_DN10681_c0_g2_i2.p1 TRINITY_DN10681_c0_g2~~TRINITY_DN10681_c0_g2_i2.p1  ORF type:complete len:140 (+),score=4.78 TRINITY_DN10681_c0_g2_i2:471-890(+)